MHNYLADFIGVGTNTDTFRPNGTDGVKGWTAIDLRADCTQAAGRVLLAVPDKTDPKGAIYLGNDLDALIDPKEVGDALGVSVAAVTIRGLVAELLVVHGKDDDPDRWKGVPADDDGKVEVWLGGEKIVDAAKTDIEAVLDEVRAATNTLGPELPGPDLSGWQIVSNRGK